MADQTKIKPLTIVILLIGALGILLLDIGCILDWIKKITLDVDFLVNALYHPISGVISISFFFLLIILLLEKSTPGRIEKIVDYLKEKKIFTRVALAITLISLILLIINSFVLLSETKAGTPNVGILTVLHAFLGILLGVFFIITITKIIMTPYLADPVKWQKLAQIVVIIVFLVLLILVIIGVAVGWIIL
jgi:hypothetical protein